MRPLHPLLLVLAAVCGWVHRQQADTIAYLVEKNRVLKEQLGKGEASASRLVDARRLSGLLRSYRHAA